MHVGARLLRVGIALASVSLACSGPGGGEVESASEATGGSASSSVGSTTGIGTGSGGGTETATGSDTELPTDSSTSSTSGEESEGTGTGECPPPPCDACTCAGGELVCACDEVAPAAGFVELPGVEYVLGQGDEGIALRSTDTRLFWAFLPAETDPLGAPLFVFFNGGPGVSSGMLMGLSTGPSTFSPGITGPDLEVVDNPHSWTGLGNLLWIDARQTGFSYGLLDQPGDPQERAAAMVVSSFNIYRDAADVLTALLSFLEARPSLRASEVILVAESYGGVRAQIMLDMMLQPQAYEDGTRRMLDPELALRIRGHNLAVHGVAEDPQTIAGQFGRQILIQPSLAGDTQHAAAGQLFEAPDSVVEALAIELGVDYKTCAEKGGPCNPRTNALNFVSAQDRSIYDSRAPESWLDDLFELVADRLNSSSVTGSLLGLDLAEVEGFAATDRARAWRAVNTGVFDQDADAGDWPEHGGELAPWDRYFVTFNPENIVAFRSITAGKAGVDTADPHVGQLFLTNLVWVDTLITQAAYDIAIYSPSIPVALKAYSGLVDNVVHSPDADEWIVEYREDVLGAPGARVIAAPHYESGHAVTLDAPDELRDDVALWIER